MKFSPQSTAYLLVSITITTNTSSSSAFVLPPRLISVNSNGSSCAPNENCAPNIKYCGANGITRTRGVCPLASSSSGDNSKDNKADGDIKKNKDVKIVDAVVESSSGLLAEINDEENTSLSHNLCNAMTPLTKARIRKRDIFKKALRDLASLSLIDYKWRSAVFKKAEADRLEEEYLSKMMGEDYASYARPMDADDTRRGPLGNAEKSAVQWLTRVIEEEGERARLIASSDGELIRPKDLPEGPLSELERSALRFLSDISDSEVERVRSGTLRPKDMKIRGPLGEAEARAVLALDKVVESERIRMERSRYTGEITRPIDIPGPIGEFEKYVGDIIRAERQRVKDRESNDGRLVRPKDASLRSGLGDVEQKAVEDWEKLAKEEKERYQSFKRFLEERRPADADKDSPLGLIEAFTVKLLNGPRLIMKTINRVQELMNSTPLDKEETAILQQRMIEIQEEELVESLPAEDEDSVILLRRMQEIREKDGLKDKDEDDRDGILGP
ncbi:hypothetical protein ACHAXN_004859 [Cyclotella atomus]